MGFRGFPHWRDEAIRRGPAARARGDLKFMESQTVAVEPFLPIAPPRGVAPAVYARWMTRLLRVLRRFRRFAA